MSHSTIPIKRIPVCGTDIDAVAMEDAMVLLDEMIEDGSGHFVCFCESHLCVQATRDSQVDAALKGASLVLPDGVAMTVGARLLGEALPERLQGPRVMFEYCRRGVTRGVRHFFYGGDPGLQRQ